MDELKLKLSTKFMRGIVAKLLTKLISKKFGYDIGIQLNKIEVENIAGKISLKLDVEAELSTDEFMNIIDEVGLD